MLFDDGPTDPTDMLNELTKPEVTPKWTRWQTTYGVSFEKQRNGSKIWFYFYDKNLPHVRESEKSRRGGISQADVAVVLRQFKTNPDKLRQKPQSIKDLEKVTGVLAVRKWQGFGKWHLYNSDFTTFNNPFGLSTGYTDSADEFEIWFRTKEEWPRRQQTVSQISAALTKFGMV